MKPIQTLQIGGGIGSLIGESHRIAMKMDGLFELVGGVFNSSHEKTLKAAKNLNVPADRAYASVEEMLEAERGRAQCVSICTPNDTHFAYSKAALEAGYHVICDKPLAQTVEECEELKALAEAKQRTLCVTYNYSGYPMVREARSRIAEGELGKLLMINVQMPQAAVSQLKGQELIHPRMQWRLNPEKSGGSMVMLDLMTHVIHLAEFVSGQRIIGLTASTHCLNNDLGAEDNAVLSCNFSDGAIGQLWASFVATGEEHGLAFSIYGDKASAHWKQVDPNYLTIKHMDATEEKLHRGSNNNSETTRNSSRIFNHPEGFFEAFANIYRDMANEIHGTQCVTPYVDATEGLRGLQVVKAATASVNQGGGKERI